MVATITPTVKTTQNKAPTAIELANFINEWEQRYRHALSDIPIFDPDEVKKWTLAQKQHFIRVLYHLRGHFAEFLWFMGNFAPDETSKQMILKNITDEFGMNGFSHEKLYFIFAQSFDVDLTYELIEERYYQPFAREYILGQLRWLRDVDWEHRAAGFAAIEKLDNLDYVNLREIAIAMGARGKALTFFNVHISVDHFENVLETSLVDIWKNNEKMVREVFDFILNYQKKMFINLSKEIFSFK